MAILFTSTDCYRTIILYFHLFISREKQGKSMNHISIINLFISSFMLGLITVTQFVSYPLFSKVKLSNFTFYHYHYTNNISFIAAPAMIAELAIAIIIFLNIQSLLSSLNLLIIVILFISTFLIQVPIHNKLKSQGNIVLFKKLVLSNIIRTILWLSKCIVSIIIIVKEKL